MNFFHAVIHPLQVGRDERIGWRATLDLRHQCRARIVASDDLDTSLLGEGRIDVVERICHRRGGKYGDGLVLRINGDWRGLLHELPNDKSKRNDAQNYK